MVSAESLWGNVLFRGKLQTDAKNSNFENFESAHYMESGSMPSSISIVVPMEKCNETSENQEVETLA